MNLYVLAVIAVGVMNLGLLLVALTQRAELREMAELRQEGRDINEALRRENRRSHESNVALECAHADLQRAFLDVCCERR